MLKKALLLVMLKITCSGLELTTGYFHQLKESLSLAEISVKT